MNAVELNGSVIKVKRCGGAYYHFGIYVNEAGEESVIHYTDDNGKKDFKGKISGL